MEAAETALCRIWQSPAIEQIRPGPRVLFPSPLIRPLAQPSEQLKRDASEACSSGYRYIFAERRIMLPSGMAVSR